MFRASIPNAVILLSPRLRCYWKQLKHALSTVKRSLWIRIINFNQSAPNTEHGFKLKSSLSHFKL